MLKLKINKENLNSPNHSHSYKYNLIHSSRFIYKPKKKNRKYMLLSKCFRKKWSNKHNNKFIKNLHFKN